ncbi:MAG: hypothetical protein HQL86_08795, partial [Magnetococcales bacterium]|nr:hypothetical protein [Magnetococcales bacterium]
MSFAVWPAMLLCDTGDLAPHLAAAWLLDSGRRRENLIAYWCNDDAIAQGMRSSFGTRTREAAEVALERAGVAHHLVVDDCGATAESQRILTQLVTARGAAGRSTVFVYRGRLEELRARRERWSRML